MDSVGQPKVEHQAADEYCSLNSIANAVPLSEELYKFIQTKGPLFDLEGIRNILNEKKGTPCQLHHIKAVQKTDLFEWLRRQKSGIFAVQFNTHCVTWDAMCARIIETDPRFPRAMHINDTTLNTLGLNSKSIEVAFKIVATMTKNPKKRKFQELLQ